MLKIILTVGCPASGKSTWAKSEIAKDPSNWIRINNDDLRSMMNGSVWSQNYEKIITDCRNYLIRDGLKRGKNVVIDNLNINRRHFDDVCKIAKNVNVDIQVIEKVFYLEYDELLERNAKREGAARVPDDIVKKWWKESGGKQFRFYKPRVETFAKRTSPADRTIEPMEQDESLPRAVIFDNDGTISLLNGRNPYDASTCDQDLPHAHVIECMKLYWAAGYKILFVSGRENKDREPTEKFYAKHFPEVKYELFMRETGDQRKDVIIKEEIFNNYIKGKYFVAGWFDDRLQVSKWVYESGLPLFRVNDPEATF